MLNTGRRKLNTTATTTQNSSHLFPTVHHTSQFRVPQFTQNVALNFDINNGWKQYMRERRKSMCVRGGEQAGRGWGRGRARCGECCQGWLCFRVFPFPSEMTKFEMWRNSSGWTNMKTWRWSRISLSNWPLCCSLLNVLYCNMYCTVSCHYTFICV